MGIHICWNFGSLADRGGVTAIRMRKRLLRILRARHISQPQARRRPLNSICDYPTQTLWLLDFAVSKERFALSKQRKRIIVQAQNGSLKSLPPLQNLEDLRWKLSSFHPGISIPHHAFAYIRTPILNLSIEPSIVVKPRHSRSPMMGCKVHSLALRRRHAMLNAFPYLALCELLTYQA